MTSAQIVRDTCEAINKACRQGVYAQYSCKSVSWDDVQRGVESGSLSCWGGNITDTRLWEKNGVALYTVRPDNWNEKLGKVDSHSIALVAGNHEHRGSLKPITLADFLQHIGAFASYAGMDSDIDLSNATLDREISIRFQTTFLPVPDEELASIEFCTEAYNYNTHHDDDPRNIILLSTTQGVAVQQDGRGAKKLFHHALDSSGTVHRYWLEAERSRHKVGTAQVETRAEARLAAVRGKATSSVIGVEAMGTRFNALMTIQVPCEQKPKPPPVPPQPPVPEFKLLLVGDGAVGKTCFVKRLLTGEFDTTSRYSPTTCAEVHTLQFYTNRGPIRFKVWDTAGQEQLGGLRDGYYVGGECAIIMCDIARQSSCDSISNWHQDLLRICPNIPIVLVGNKIDRATTSGRHLQHNLPYYELSSQSNINLEEPFLCLARKLAGDNNLVIVEAPALQPPEFTIDPETQAKYEQELAAASAFCLSEVDFDEDDDSPCSATPPPKETSVGESNAARVSRGTEVLPGQTWNGLCNKRPKRDPNQHITVTVVLYNTVSGGVPSVTDVKAAIDDMERLYASCQWKGRLAEPGANFMKQTLTQSDCSDVAEKLINQPYQPEGLVVQNATVFPSSTGSIP